MKHFLILTRLNRPTGIYLLALPCFFGVALAVKNSVEISAQISLLALLKTIILFALGSVVMRSAGCIINDIFDRPFDMQIARTKNRPLANGAVTMPQALILLIALLFVGLLILLQFNSYVIASGFMALGLVVVYPLMKRITFYPQIFLGLTFNFGIIMADLAVNEKIFITTLLLYSASVLWTLIYDTFYAFQDIEDDIKIGVKSTAIKFSARPRATLAILATSMLALLFTVGLLKNFSAAFYFFAFAAFLFEIFLITTRDYSSAPLCLKAFKANIFVGILILVAIIFG